jgi:orotidine-5'-phosphate decarboxylase
MHNKAVRNFGELMHTMASKRRFLCVGLDPDITKIPASLEGASATERMLAFNMAIIDATHDVVGAYKPNSAFYEAHGAEGVIILRDTIEYIHQTAPDVTVILDAKRADIGNTNNGYVAAAFDYLGADAITVHPYMGGEALAPFFARKDKGVFVLCRTSNMHSDGLQDLMVDEKSLYMHVARMFAESWNGNGNCGLVVGATYPKELTIIRSEVGDLPILVPGIGAQGGDLTESVRAAKTSDDRGFIINAGRSVIYASSDADFAQAARSEALTLDGAVKKALVE